ncbi:S24 family peptidase [Massilia sp. H-1]|nr:S24 family peptidase [Massilia sp. H-1]
MDGDKVIIDRSVAPEHGRLVVAVIDGQYTLRRLFHFNGRAELRSENEALPPQRSEAGGRGARVGRGGGRDPQLPAVRAGRIKAPMA